MPPNGVDDFDLFCNPSKGDGEVFPNKEGSDSVLLEPKEVWVVSSLFTAPKGDGFSSFCRLTAPKGEDFDASPPSEPKGEDLSFAFMVPKGDALLSLLTAPNGEDRAVFSKLAKGDWELA